MKNAKRIGIALLLVVLIGVLVIFTALANNGNMYTGTIYQLETYVNRLIDSSDDEGDTRAEREDIITTIDTYLAEYPVNPDAEGYADLVLVVKNAKIRLTNEYLADAQDDKADTTKKASALKGASKWFELTPYTADDMKGDDYKKLVDTMRSIAIPVAQEMLENIYVTTVTFGTEGNYKPAPSAAIDFTDVQFKDDGEDKTRVEGAFTIKVKKGGVLVIRGCLDKTSYTLSVLLDTAKEGDKPTEIGVIEDVEYTYVATSDCKVIITPDSEPYDAKNYFCGFSITNPDLGDFAVAYKYKIFSSFMNNTEFDEDSNDYKVLKEEYDSLKEKYEGIINERKQALYDSAPLDEYGYGLAYNTGFNAGQPVPDVSGDTDTNSLGAVVQTEVVTETETLADGTVNSYRTMRFKGGDTALSTYFSIAYEGAERGMVFEFEITTMGSLPRAGTEAKPTGGIAFQARPSEGTSTWLYIDGKGALMYCKKGGTKAEATFANNNKVIVPGEWTHISIVFDPANPHDGKLYIDYKLVAEDLEMDYNNWGYTAAKLRIGNQKNTTGEISIDNIKFTKGTAHRDEQYLNRMSASERFAYYADYLANEDYLTFSRMVAYNNMTDLIITFAVEDEEATEVAGKTMYKVADAYKEDQAIIRAITIYNNSDVDAIKNEYMADNLAKLREMIAELEKIDINLSTITDRSNKINSASTFITNNKSYITQGEAYDECQTILANAIIQLELDRNAFNFVTVMQAFAESESLVILEVKYREAKTLLETIGERNVDTLKQKPGYEDFKTACELYNEASITIGDALDVRNSKDIVDSVDYIISLYPDEVDWKLYRIEDVNNPGDLNGDGIVNSVDISLAVQNNKDFDFIDSHLTIIRRMVNGGYSENYIGVNSAIQRYEPLNAHYYDILQKEHAKHIEEQLDVLASTQSFINKEGIIAYLKRYNESNDVDVTHASIAPLMIKLNAYEEELQYQEGNYTNLLRMNTSFFVNKVKMFDTAVTYLEKKALFDDATLYYYEMNATSDEVDVASAIAKYNRMAAELAAVSEASAEFIRNVSLLPVAETRDDYYGYLVGAMLQYGNIDESVEGVVEAKATYLEAYNAYCAKVEATNDEICETGAALGSLRANCGLSAIISAFIERIFNF